MTIEPEVGPDLPGECTRPARTTRDSANARAAFGDPVERAGRTVIPVARVGTGFGGGLGRAPSEDLAAGTVGGSGMGGGGGATARPIGALEISDRDTRFVPISTPRARVLGLVGCFGLGLLLGRVRAGRRARSSASD